MEERLKQTIQGLRDFDAIAIFQRNAHQRSRLTDEVAAAIDARAIELGRAYIAEKTGLTLTDLSPAEEKIVYAVAKYAAIKRRKNAYPSRTLEQLRDLGLIGAAESAVINSAPTQGYRTLAEEHLMQLSYEQIIVDHEDEFSPRAVWYARRTLDLPNSSAKAPAKPQDNTSVWCFAAVDWLERRARELNGRLYGHTNADVAAAIGIDNLSKYGRVLGNISSRIDFACYVCGLPPLGLTVQIPFADAWRQDDRDWAFPIADMQRKAQAHLWRSEEFRAVREHLKKLPGQAYISWRLAIEVNEPAVRDWALAFARTARGAVISSPEPTFDRPSTWCRDELIVTLDFFLRNRGAIPAIASPAILALTDFLGELRHRLGHTQAYIDRDPNGVYSKVQSFARLDTHDLGLVASLPPVLEQSVWNDFAEEPGLLSDVVEAIRAAFASQAVEDDDDFDAQDEAEEGRLLTRAHRSRERNRQLVLRKKEQAFLKHGKLCCEGCGFHFASKYGADAAGIIDCHHMRPVHTLREGDRTHLEELALLCSNCHRVIHATKKWRSLKDLQALVQLHVDSNNIEPDTGPLPL